MTMLPPPLEALPQLYLRLLRRVEKIDGQLQQLLAERTRNTTAHATIHDVQSLWEAIAEIRSLLPGGTAQVVATKPGAG